MNECGKHAVVLGASMGGLLAARVLADVYEQVTVVERDFFPEGPSSRRGVPQSRHGHALLPRGAQALEELFPGLLGELTSVGVPLISEDASRLHFSTGGHRLYSGAAPQRSLRLYLPSRPLLEHRVRARLRELTNVAILERCDAAGLRASEDGARVTGVRIADRAGEAKPRMLDAQLVVDATGRGARTPAWLEQLGYPRPPEQRVQVDVTYASVLLRLPPGQMHERMVLIGARAGRPRGCALFCHEGGTWMFTVAGMAGHRPPIEQERMASFVQDFAPAHMLSVVRAAEPLSEIATHRFPVSRWRRYDRMRRLPQGLLAFGDAIASFNPLYGQGMTVAALQAEALARCLRGGERDLSRRFFRAAAEPVGLAWQLGSGADLALPEVPGRRPLSVRISNAIVERYLRAAEHDPHVSEQFFRVAAFLDPPSRLLRAPIGLRVGTAALRRERLRGRAESSGEAEPVR